MTDDNKALVERLIDTREYHCMMYSQYDTVTEAANRIEALSAENERLREVLKQIEAGTYPRPLGKSWRMDLSSSKHDRCIHDEWMYEVCEECLDDFVRAALGEQQ